MDARSMMLAICQKLIPKAGELCQLDSFVGDGDHGLTVERGFCAVRARLESACDLKAAEVFEETGDVLAESMGGAIGPILGGFFSGPAKRLRGREELGATEMKDVFAYGLKRVTLIGGAQAGDRTLVDALIPAAQAYDRAIETGAPLADCLRQAAGAAWQGAENTKNLVARHGRAKFLGEKSLGYVDAGAVTMSLIIQAMAECAESEPSKEGIGS